MLPGPATGAGLAAVGDEPANALVQYRRIRRPQSGGRNGFRYGTVKRNSVVGPWHQQLRRLGQQELHGSADDHVEFRIEIFNLPNQAIWGQPGSQLRTPTYGVITSTRMDSRQVQIGLKLVF